MKAFSEKVALAMSGLIVAAEDNLISYLRAHFPKGAKCEVFLMHGQKTPTKATIWNVEASRYGGQVRVEIETAKPRSRQRFRSVSSSAVVNVRPTANGAAGQDAALAAQQKNGGE